MRDGASAWQPSSFVSICTSSRRSAAFQSSVGIARTYRHAPCHNMIGGAQPEWTLAPECRGRRRPPRPCGRRRLRRSARRRAPSRNACQGDWELDLFPYTCLDYAAPGAENVFCEFGAAASTFHELRFATILNRFNEKLKRSRSVKSRGYTVSRDSA